MSSGRGPEMRKCSLLVAPAPARLTVFELVKVLLEVRLGTLASSTNGVGVVLKCCACGRELVQVHPGFLHISDDTSTRSAHSKQEPRFQTPGPYSRPRQ